MTRKYLRKEEADLNELYSRKDLKNLFRLKPAKSQIPAGEVWQGLGKYDVYEKKLCVPMRQYRKPTEKQLAALAQGRDCIGTTQCNDCKKRFPHHFLDCGLCDVCDALDRRANCTRIAQKWMASETTLILDTESSGLDDRAEIVEITIIDMQGKILLDTLIKPSASIPDEATEIHGISDADVQNAPSWADIYDEFVEIVKGKEILIYNSSFDTRLLAQSSVRHGLPAPALEASCVMTTYAHWYGEVGYRGGYIWQSLVAAAQQCGIDASGAHRSLADCKLTLAVIQYLSSACSTEQSNWL